MKAKITYFLWMLIFPLNFFAQKEEVEFCDEPFQPKTFSSTIILYNILEKKIYSIIYIMADIDEERLQTLMEAVNKEHPDLDPYVIWVICVNYL